MTASSRFAPNETLAAHLLPVISTAPGDGSHDLSHLLRVWKNVQHLMAREGGDAAILTAATLLHDCVDVPKHSPQRSRASRLAGQKAAQVLEGIGWVRAEIERVVHTIEAHSFSAGIPPETLEAKILQDADRLDAIGHIGIVRCFYVSGRMGGSLYDPDDAEAVNRPLEDSRFAVDHFKTKLLKLSGMFQTDTGQRPANERHKVTADFLEGLLDEVSPERNLCL